MSSYNLKDPNTPILSGRLLAVLCNVVEAIGEATGITKHLCNDAGLYCLRAIDYAEAPTAMPVWTPNQEMAAAAVSDQTNTFSAHDYLAKLQKEADIEATKGPKSDGAEHRFLSCRDFYVAYKSGGKTPVEVQEKKNLLIQTVCVHSRCDRGYFARALVMFFLFLHIRVVGGRAIDRVHSGIRRSYTFLGSCLELECRCHS